MLFIVTKMTDFISNVKNLDYCSDFTTESQESLLLFHKCFICWLIKSIMFFLSFIQLECLSYYMHIRETQCNLFILCNAGNKIDF